MSRTWSPLGHRAWHTPSPPTPPGPTGGQAGSTRSLPPRGRGHETIAVAGYHKPLRARESARQTVSPNPEHAVSPPYGWRPVAPIHRLGAPSPRRSHETQTPATGGVPDAHLHDAVRGLGCRHLHQNLFLQPPRPPLLCTPPGPPYTGGVYGPPTATPPEDFIGTVGGPSGNTV